jgi:DHA1 family tetracycline resistance protein-like MFS transporter
VLIRWFGGEQRAALAGMAAAVLAYLGYAFATEGWMMYAVGLTIAFFALTYPAMNGLASQRVPANAQGELQGAVASVYGLSSIVGPPLMTQVFGYFSAPTARMQFPGAPFITAAVLTIGCATLFAKAQAVHSVQTS